MTLGTMRNAVSQSQVGCREPLCDEVPRERSSFLQGTAARKKPWNIKMGVGVTRVLEAG
jgi:hypothetical protein